MNTWKAVRDAEAEKKRLRVYSFQKRRRDAGLCIDCGQPRNGASNSYCISCKLKRKKWAHERYMMDKEVGLCYICEKNAAIEGQAWCEDCKAKRSARAKELRKQNRPAREHNIEKGRERYRRLREQGLCTICGKVKTDGQGKCEACKKRYAVWQKNRYLRLQSEHRCISCGNPLDVVGYVYCSKCRERNKNYRKKEG